MPTLLITVDSLRAESLGQYGYERETMPALDRLVDDGTVFESGFSNAPYTRVSIPSFHTSRYLGYGNLDGLPTVASTLSTGGVPTTAIGTQTGIEMIQGGFGFDEMVDLGRDGFEEGEQRSPTERLAVGVDSVATRVSEWLQHRRMDRVYEALAGPYNALVGSTDRLQGYRSAETVTDRAIEWLDGRAGEDFFLWLHYMEAHRPYGIHDEEPAYLDGPLDDDRIRELMRKAGTEPEAMTERDRRLMIDLYDSDLRYCSRHLERLFDALRAEGLWTESNVLLSSDHGEEFGEHGLYFHRNYPYDEVIHVPLIAKTAAEGPATGGPAPPETPDRVGEQRELLDLAPTICGWHGVDVDGTGFLGTALFEGAERTVISLGQPGMDEPALAVRADGWKLIHSESERQLYDLEADSDETENVIEEHPRVAARLRRKAPERLFGRDVKAPRAPDDEVDREQLQALGYMELREDGDA